VIGGIDAVIEQPAGLEHDVRLIAAQLVGEFLDRVVDFHVRDVAAQVLGEERAVSGSDRADLFRIELDRNRCAVVWKTADSCSMQHS
jgi:hypothetical protein